MGIEPTHKGFADLSLTTWVPRPAKEGRHVCLKKIWSGKRDSNPRLRPWQGRTLPLSYSRSNATNVNFASYIQIIETLETRCQAEAARGGGRARFTW